MVKEDSCSIVILFLECGVLKRMPLELFLSFVITHFRMISPLPFIGIFTVSEGH